MATAPQPQLPLFYNDLMPLNSRDHATWHTKTIDSAKWLAGQHAIPLTVDEFVPAQRAGQGLAGLGESVVPGFAQQPGIARAGGTAQLDLGRFLPFHGQKKNLARRKMPCFHGTRCDTPLAFLNWSR